MPKEPLWQYPRVQTLTTFLLEQNIPLDQQNTLWSHDFLDMTQYLQRLNIRPVVQYHLERKRILRF